MKLDSIAIVGVGLIGGSIARAARTRRLCRRLIGVGRSEAKLRHCRDLGLIDSYSSDLAQGVREAELVVVCSPVDRIATDLLIAAKACRPGTLLTDVGSTKANIVRDVQSSLPEGIDFVGSHPLAGSEKQGADNSRADLFENRICILTPTAETPDGAVRRGQQFWEALGSTVKILSPEEHDQALAATSHLPHFLASILAGQLPERWQLYAATGFRDTTRIAAGDPELWAAIARENTIAIASGLDEFAGRLARFRDALLQNDTTELMRFLTEGKKVRDALGS